MNGEDNLVPLSDRPEEERKKIASMGGKARAKAIQRRKTLKEELLLLLSQGDTQEKVSVALIQQALEGNTKAFEVLRDTVGEKPKETIEYTHTVDETVKEIETFMEKEDV